MSQSSSARLPTGAGPVSQHQQRMAAAGAAAHQPAAVQAVPTLRVMRLQNPELHQPSAGVLLAQHNSNNGTAGGGGSSPLLMTEWSGGGGEPSMLQGSMCLPDSLSVNVGETFTAYIGVLNTSTRQPIRRLAVTAHLQTPSQRHQLHPDPHDMMNTMLSSTNTAGPATESTGSLHDHRGGVDVGPLSGIDVIVKQPIEEGGQHILRVEVGYQTSDGGTKTFRKFYRFQVTNPLSIQHKVVRGGDDRCYVSVTVTYLRPATASGDGDEQGGGAVPATNKAIVISDTAFQPTEGLAATRIQGSRAAGGGGDSSSGTDKQKQQLQSGDYATTRRQRRRNVSALQLLDKSGMLLQGSSYRYLFLVEAVSAEKKKWGITAGDCLGHVVFTWQKAMGESGRVPSSTMYCPVVKPVFPPPMDQQPTLMNNYQSNRNSNNDFAAVMNANDAEESFVVYRSGLSVDVPKAAAAARAATTSPTRGGGRQRQQTDKNDLSIRLPVTVEPIDPPSTMRLNTPRRVQFLVVNHGAEPAQLQLQFRFVAPGQLNSNGLAICGSSSKNLGLVQGQSGSTIATVQFIGLAAGLFRLTDCYVVNLASGQEIAQPPLFHVFVESDDQCRVDTGGDEVDDVAPSQPQQLLQQAVGQ